jgi:hypothetical protein
MSVPKFVNRINNKHLLPILLLVLGITIFHWRGIRPGYTFLPVDLAGNNLPWTSGQTQPLQNWLISDPLYQFYSFTKSAVDAIRQGEGWLLWNPKIFLGHPALGDPLSQPFYPLYVVIGLIFGAARGIALGLWLQVVLAGLFSYGWLQVIGCKRPAVLAGAFVYALSGYLVTWFETTFWVSTLTWLPAVLWAYELAIRRRSLRFTALAAMLMALAMLGGQYQFLIVFTVFFALYAIGRSIEASKESKTDYLWPILMVVLTIAPAFLLSAISLIPAIELLSVSRRSAPIGLLDPMLPQQLVTLISPNIYGNPATGGGYWGAGNFSESTMYTSVVAFLMAVLAPISKRRFFTIYMSLVTVGIIYFIIGGPGVKLLGMVPGLKYASLHRTAFILPLMVALLSGITLSTRRIPPLTTTGIAIGFGFILLLIILFDVSNVNNHWSQLKPQILRTGLLLTIAVGLIWARFRYARFSQTVTWCLTGLIFVDLFWFGSRFNPAGPVDQLMPLTPSIAYLQENVGEQRIVAVQRDDKVIFGPNIPSIFGLPEAGGYSSLIPRRYHDLVAADDPELDISWMNRNGNMLTFSYPSTRLLDLLQVSLVVAPNPLEDPVIRAEIVTEACERNSHELADKYPLQGSFEVRDTAINRIDFRFVTQEPVQTQGTVKVQLKRADKEAQIVLEGQEEVAVLAVKDRWTLFFEPQKDAPGQGFRWEISTDAEKTGLALCLDGDDQPAVSVYGSDWQEAYQGEVFIYERMAPMPRAYVVYAAEYIGDEAQAINRLLDEEFEIRHVAVTAQPTSLPSKPEIMATTAHIESYSNNEIVIQAYADRPGLLILGDQFYPGWEATVDGIPVPVINVNLILRAAPLSPGNHQVVFTFRPVTLRIGMWLGVLGIILVVLYVLIDSRLRETFGVQPTRKTDRIER